MTPYHMARMGGGDSAPAGEGILFANVRLQLHCNGTDGAIVLPDSSAFSRTMTRYGSPEIDTAQSVFGGSSLYVPGGSTNGFYCDSDADLDMRAGAFQIDWRHRLAANLTDVNQPDAVMSMVNGDTWFYEWGIVVDRYYLRFYYGRRGVTSGGARWRLPAGFDFGALGGVWVACSIARDASGNWGAWVDGVRCESYGYQAQAAVPSWTGDILGTMTDGTDFGASGSRRLNIGSFYTFSGLSVDKHIAELRYVVGQSRSVFSGYTPLATPFPDS